MSPLPLARLALLLCISPCAWSQAAETWWSLQPVVASEPKKVGGTGSVVQLSLVDDMDF